MSKEYKKSRRKSSDDDDCQRVTRSRNRTLKDKELNSRERDIVPIESVPHYNIFQRPIIKFMLTERSLATYFHLTRTTKMTRKLFS